VLSVAKLPAVVSSRCSFPRLCASHKMRLMQFAYVSHFGNVMTDGQSASLPVLMSATNFSYYLKLYLLTRDRICNLQLLLDLASTVFLGLMTIFLLSQF
jgi:hypothetical protein